MTSLASRLADSRHSCLKHMTMSYDSDRKALWHWMNPKDRPSFTEELMSEMSSAMDLVEKSFENGETPYKFLVLGSRLPGIFNYGGNLEQFEQLIRSGQRERIRQYAHFCTIGQHRRATNLNGIDFTSIALVQGDALGGGFECALSHNVIIAEKGMKFSFPEIIFNMFPGMGAYTFLCRKIGSEEAKKMILSGKSFLAEDLLAMGIIDYVTDVGEGEQAVNDYIDRITKEKTSNLSKHFMRKVVEISDPFSLKEMLEITDIWVENAMALSEDDLRRMNTLARRQNRVMDKINSSRG